MMKICVIDINNEFYDELVAQDEISSLANVNIDLAIDTNMQKYSENFFEYVHKMEHEGPEWIVPDKEVLEKCRDVDLILTHWCGVNSTIIESSKNLKAIMTLRSGSENINVDYAKRKGVSVSICPSRLANPVADMTIALMLSECRGLLRDNLRYNHGNWKKTSIMDSSTASLSNLSIGLVGYGGISKAVAKRLVCGFGATVYAYDPFVDDNDIQKDGVLPASMDELLSKSDIVSLHTRLTPETKGSFGYEQFSKMKPTAIFINTARGALVDEEALIDALEKKRIRGAGLDVFEKEPIDKDSPLLKMENVTATPHVSGQTTDSIVNSVKILKQELLRFINGEKLLNTV